MMMRSTRWHFGQENGNSMRLNKLRIMAANVARRVPVPGVVGPHQILVRSCAVRLLSPRIGRSDCRGVGKQCGWCAYLRPDGLRFGARRVGFELRSSSTRP